MSDHPVVKMDEWSALFVFAMPVVSLLYDYAFTPLFERYQQTKPEGAAADAEAPADSVLAETSVRFALAPGKRAKTVSLQMGGEQAVTKNRGPGRFMARAASRMYMAKGPLILPSATDTESFKKKLDA